MSSRKANEYFGYKHWTLEETSRCFNVGRGHRGRPTDLKQRSRKHKAITKRYGIRVEICVGPISFEESNSWEIENIAKEGTFSSCYSHNDPNDIGCNFTLGGGGAKGCTTGKLGDENPAKRPEVRAKISKTLTGRPGPNKGVPVPANQRLKISKTLTGKKQSAATKQKRRVATLGKPQRCSLCKRMGHKKFLCPTLPNDMLEANKESVRQKHSAANKASWQSEARRAKQKRSSQAYWSKPESHVKASASAKRAMQNPENLRKISEGLKGKTKGRKRTELQRLRCAAAHNKSSIDIIDEIERLLQEAKLNQVAIAKQCNVVAMTVTTVKQGKHYFQRARTYFRARSHAWFQKR